MRTLSLFRKRPEREPAAKKNHRQISSAFPGVAASIALLAAICTAGCGYTGGNAAAQLTASTKQLSFGSVTIGTSTAQLVTLTATGTANVVISGIKVNGNGFSTSNRAGITLTPSQSVTVSVNFEPTAAGTDSGDLSINSTGYPMQIALSGTGVQSGGQQSNSSSHSVALSWQATPTVIGYYVYRGAAAGSLAKVSSALDPTTSYTDTAVTNGQTYVYSVTSVDASYVESPQSSPVTVTIPN